MSVLQNGSFCDTLIITEIIENGKRILGKNKKIGNITKNDGKLTLVFKFNIVNIDNVAVLNAHIL